MMDFNKLTKAQRRVLGLIAINQDEGHHPRTLEALLKKGLIRRTAQILPGPLPVRVYIYYVPIHVHIAWCQWCCDHPDEED